MTALHACWAAWALSFAGMAALALAMDRHYELPQGRVDMCWRRRWLLRTAGASLLLGAIVPCVWAWGGSVAWVASVGFWSMGGLSVLLALTWLPRWLACAAAFAALCAAVGLALLGPWA